MADLEDFCGSTFWDINEIWNTTNPDVPECFQKTVLVWVPCIFLWVLCPVEIIFSRKSTASPLPWTMLNVTRMMFCLMLMVLALADMSHWLMLYTENYDVPYVNYNTPFIKALTYFLSFILLLVLKMHGRRDSGIIFIFWLLSLIGGTVMYRSRIMNALNPDEDSNSVDFILFMITYPLLFGQFILAAFADKVPEESDKFDDKEPCPELEASFLSRMLFAWFDSMAILGFKKPLTNSNLWKLNPENECGYVVQKFTKYWDEEKKKYLLPEQSSELPHGPQDRKVSIADKPKKQKQPSILSALWRSFRWTFLFAGFLRFLGDMLSFASPLILQLLIDFVSSDEPEWRGYFYCALIIVCSLTQSIIFGQQYLRMFNIAMRVRSAVVSAIYHKALRISNSVKRSSTVGEIVNLMSVDAQRLMDLLPELHVAWSAVVQIVVALYLLWNQLGPSVLAGIGVMILMIPVNGAIAGRIKIYQIKNMRNKDTRVKLMNEVLNGIKVLKLYAWEQSFFEQITGIRSRELKVMKSAAYLNASAAFVFNTVPFMVSLVTFATYVLIDDKNILDATKAFVSLSLFNIIRLPLFFIPMLFISIIQAAVSFKRMNKFLNNEELDPDAVLHDLSEENPVVVRNGTFAWGAEDEAILHNISLEIPEGSLVAVVGTVGSGKSSLISAILGEMEKREGIVNTKGSIAYVAQQAWIQNATVQDNITFGQPFEKSLYRKVIEACALKQDLEMLPGGDQTEIGEKGINLSGGQKQRVSLARAVYSNSDVIFLDDPLSAVDSHVGKHIFEEVIGPTGYLKNKTRLFVTNNITYLPKVDSIIVLTNGRISEVGSFKELLEKKGAFADFLVTYIKEQDSAELSDEEMTDLEEIAQDIIAKVGNPELERQLSRKLSVRSHHSDGGVSSDGDRSSSVGARRKSREPSIDMKSEKFGRLSKDAVGTKLIQVETTETGKVHISVYMQYVRAIGLWMAILTFVPNVLSTACNVGSSIWLSAWSQDQPLPDGSQDTAMRDLRLGIYGLLGFGQAILVLAASFSLAFGTINASNILHENMLSNILKCPMSFFDTTPLGRIVNRFSKDIDVVDATIPMILRPLLSCFLQVLSTLIVISTSTPIFMVMIPPMGLIYFFIQRIYISTSRQLKRLESITRSPIFSHFSESVGGSSTIRAYGKVAAFVKENEMKVDNNQICYYPSIIANRWLSIRLEFVSNIIIFSSALFAVLNRDTLDPGSVGLSISYSFSINAVLIFMVRMTSDLETNIVAIERIKEYSESKTEAPWKIEESEPPNEWPQEGIINFEKFSTRYREGLELVLKELSCNINSGEKIGIVGRTGAGKSSMTLGLFRIIEPAAGSIVIDNINIFKIGLHDLRSKLTIIPQDPVLFSGTLRMNLDPFSRYSDEEVWKALEQSHLKSFVKGLSAGLQHEISEGGENLSVGQRQLVCLARALLRKTKVLVLDEATAAVDLETDDLIQATIRKEFADCTVLTIAHRLNTIMDSNRVMVLDQGKITEFDSPRVLLQNKKTIFYGMCKDAGLV